MSHLNKWVTLKEIVTLEKIVTIEKMGNWNIGSHVENLSPLEKWIALGKMGHTLKKLLTAEKNGSR